MAGTIGKWQVRKATTFNGLVKENQLVELFRKCPQQAPWAMVQLLQRNDYGKAWESFLSQFPVKYFKDHSKYYWDVMGDARRNIPVVDVRAIDGTTYVGAAGVTDSTPIGASYEPFYIVFNEDYFHKGEVIYGMLNEKTVLRVRSEKPIMEGRNAVYEVECFGAKMQNGIPYKYVKPGQRYSYGPAYVGETLSREVGDLGYESPMGMSNNWSTVRIKTKVPGGSENIVLEMGIPVSVNGKVRIEKYWTPYVDLKLEAKFKDYKDLAIVYGVSTENEDGSFSNFDFSGEPIKTGDGLLDQMARNGERYYNDFSLEMLNQALYELSVNTTGLNGNRTYVLSCGEAFAIDFNKAVKSDVSGWYMTTNADAIGAVKKVSSELHSNALGAGFQFTEYYGPNNVTIKLHIDPWKDDPVVNKLQWKGAPAMSRRADLFFIGDEQQPNIQLCRVEGAEEYRGYMWGIRNSFTKEMVNPHMSYDEDSTSIHKMSNQFGICILDPTRTRSFIPDVLQGF